VFEWFQKLWQQLFSKQQNNLKAHAYFPSETELPGFEAIPRKRELETRLLRLSEQSDLSSAERQEKAELEAELQKLLQHATFVSQVQSELTSEPVLSVSEQAHHTSSEWLDPQLRLQRVLLIEDDPDVSMLIRYLLEHSQFVVTLINNGGQAKQWIQSEPPPDLVSLDIMLPQCDGLELVELVRSQPGWEKVPILMLTSKSDEPTIRQALQKGANDYLSKPFQPDEYLARVRHLTA